MTLTLDRHDEGYTCSVEWFEKDTKCERSCTANTIKAAVKDVVSFIERNEML
jgi:hypothetical protein